MEAIFFREVIPIRGRFLCGIDLQEVNSYKNVVPITRWLNSIK